MGIMVYSLSWVMQALGHQLYGILYCAVLYYTMLCRTSFGFRLSGYWFEALTFWGTQSTNRPHTLESIKTYGLCLDSKPRRPNLRPPKT